MRLLAALVVAMIVAVSCSDDNDMAEQAEGDTPLAIDLPSTSSPESVTSSSPTTSVTTTTAAPEADLTDPSVVVDPVLMANGAGRNAELFAEIAEVAGTPDDAPFFMVNLLDIADVAHYPEDSEFFGSTGAEANARYSAVSNPRILGLGGEIVFAGPVTRTLISTDGIQWDFVAVVRYPSRASMIELFADEAFEAAAVHKWASLDNTFALMTEQVELAAAPEPDPASLPFPSTEDDPSVVVFHLLNFHEIAQYEPGEEPYDAPISGKEAVARYTANAGLTAAPLGVRPRGWFDVVGPVITDGRTWDETRINEFPSTAAFAALTGDPGWAQGTFHRTAGVEETYALMVHPVLFRRELLAPAAG